jgi:hypothetical protein
MMKETHTRHNCNLAGGIADEPLQFAAIDQYSVCNYFPCPLTTGLPFLSQASSFQQATARMKQMILLARR